MCRRAFKKQGFAMPSAQELMLDICKGAAYLCLGFSVRVKDC